MKGQRITSTARGDMRPLAVQGILVPDCYNQVTDILRSRLGEDYARLFAEPVFDEERMSADWYTPLNGVPRRLDEVDQETQNAVRERLAAMAEKVRHCARSLSSPQGGQAEQAKGDSGQAQVPASRRLAGEILECALQYPQTKCLYLVGDQPVVICWGCGPITPGVEAQDLSRLRPVLAAPRAPGSPAGASGAIPGAASGAEALAARQTTAAAGTGCLPRALALLLLLLLLGLLAAFFLGKMPALFTSLSGWGLPVPVMDSRAMEQEKNREVALLAEMERLRLDVIQRKALCGKGGTSPVLTVPPLSTVPLPPVPKQELAVPSDASSTGDLSFLKGKWICDSGLADSAGKSVVVIYDFDANGDGSIAIQGPAGLCLGKTKSSISKEGVLTITSDPSIPCPDGQSFRGQSIQCKAEEGQTQCRGNNRDSQTIWEAVFSKR